MLIAKKLIVKDVADIMETWSPTALAEEWDNVGLLLGDYNTRVNKILVALDITEDVVQEAVSGKYDLIISHHPLIYNPLKNITSASPSGRKILTLLKEGVNVYSAHTNLDKSTGGVNDCLFERLGLENSAILLEEGEGIGLGRVGMLPNPMNLSELVLHVKNSLNLPNIRFAGDANAVIRKVGLCGGDASGERFIKAAYELGCEAYLTGDLRYHTTQEALEMGIQLIDMTHYTSEIFVVDAIVGYLRSVLSGRGYDVDIQATAINGQVFDSM